MDAVGGGGWGPIVTSTLIGRGRDPRYTIGSVNAAEFAVSFASGITFLLFQGINGWQVIAGLIVGGVVAVDIDDSRCGAVVPACSRGVRVARSVGVVYSHCGVVSWRAQSRGPLSDSRSGF